MITQKLKSKVIALTSIAVLSTSLTFSSSASASEPFIGQITMFGGTFAPRSWAFCDGQLLSISGNTALFSILGTTYGGDGRTTFGLPDLRGRSPIHKGQGAGLSNISLGQRGGNETTTLTVVNMPNHTHDVSATLKAVNTSGNNETPEGNVLAKKSRSKNYSSSTPDVAMNTSAIEVVATATGGNQAFSNRSPYLAVNYIIALQGVYPSRN